MKKLITLIVAFTFTVSTFAIVTPNTFIITPEVKALLMSPSSLQLNLKAGGKVVLTWKAGIETTTTVYRIEKSVNNEGFKTVAYLIGETNESYIYKDNIKETTGTITYRVIMVDNNKDISTLNQNLVVL